MWDAEVLVEISANNWIVWISVFCGWLSMIRCTKTNRLIGLFSHVKPDLPAVRSAKTHAVRAATVKTVKAKAAPASGATSNKPQIKIIKSIPLVSPKVSTGAAVSSSSSSKPTIIYVTLPRHLFK